MKPFRHLIFFSIIFLAIGFFSFNLSHAATFDASLTEDGIVHLSGSDSFECPLAGSCASWVDIFSCLIPPGSQSCGPGPLKRICSDSATIEFETTADLRCSYPGNYLFRAIPCGGKLIHNGDGTTGCLAIGHPAMDAIVNLPLDREISINSPNGRVTGIENIVVSFKFSYMTDSCYRSGCNCDSCKGRSLSINVINNGITYPVYFKRGTDGLGLEGTITVPFNFSNLSGKISIRAQACCFTCRTVEKIVYKEPEDNPCLGVGKPVNVVSGSVYTSETDFSIPGVMPINFTRYYKSTETSSRGFGQFWSHSFDTKVISFGTNTYKILNPNGTAVYYIDNDGDGIYTAELPKGEKSRLIKKPDTTFVREFFDGTKEEFTKWGYLTAIIDRNGNRITFTRDSNYSITKITDASGRQITVTNTSGKITSITLPDGKVYTYSYPSPGYLGSVTYPDGSKKNYEYVVYGCCYRLSGIKDENGNYIEKHTYDAQGRGITSSADGTNNLLTITYVDDTHSKVTDSLGRVTTYTIDKSGGKSHATSISGPGCKECGQGNVSYTYDDNLNVTSITDGNGNITTMTYDDRGNMLTKTEASGTANQRTTTYTYEPTFNQVTSITDPKGNITTFGYDSKGNLISTTDAIGATTSFTRNTQGLITQITDAQGNTTSFTYDQYGNPATITDSLGNTTTYTYDIMGTLLSVTDANGNQTTYTYDLRNRLTQIRDSLNQLTNYTYDPSGNLTAVTDAKGNATQFVYDNINRLIRETNALGNQRNYIYDTQSNLTSKTDAAGRATTYSYNDYNRLTTINHPGGTQTTFTYDSLGNITGAANPNIAYTFTYDALNRKTTVTDSLSRIINYTYDANSNKVSMTDPLGGITQYTYNPLNKVASIRDPLGHLTSYTYDNLGRRTGMILPNGITNSYNYDNLSRLLSILNGSTSSNSYVYDNVGNRTSMTNNSGTHNYAYDEIYRLMQATHPTPPTEQFSYDQVGNRLTDNSGNSYFYNNANQLLNFDAVTFEYDANGNTTSKTDSCGTITYSWDTENRLTGINGFGTQCSPLSASYKYDPFGRRIEKNVNGAITKFVYDSEDIIAEYDGNNQLIASYTHGHGIDEPISMTNGQTYYYHTDALGSVIAITDSSGNVMQRYEYDSFGNIVSVLDPNFKQPYTYTAREYDEETGLYFYRARYYDAEVGRFLSEDPILKPISLRFALIGTYGSFVWLIPSLTERPKYLHAFNYVANNPIMFTDPNGLGWIDWIIKKIINKLILKVCDNDNTVPEEGDDDGDGNPNFSDPDSPYCKINCTK